MRIFSFEISANRHNSGECDFNRIAKWPEIASPAFLFFKISLGAPPPPPPGSPYKKRNMGKFWLSFNYPTSAPRHHHPLSYWYKNAQIFAKHLPMIVYDFVIHGFICSL